MTPDQLTTEYEVRLNRHEPGPVLELLSPDAVFWFNDGSYEGLEAIGEAMRKTWETIQDEEYRILNKRWLSRGPDTAVCIYDFRWKGLVDGETWTGGGRGTTVLTNSSGAWKIVHEHLSTPR